MHAKCKSSSLTTIKMLINYGKQEPSNEGLNFAALGPNHSLGPGALTCSRGAGPQAPRSENEDFTWKRTWKTARISTSRTSHEAKLHLDSATRNKPNIQGERCINTWNMGQTYVEASASLAAPPHLPYTNDE
mgnify:CR=1 FL=1